MLRNMNKVSASIPCGDTCLVIDFPDISCSNIVGSLFLAVLLGEELLSKLVRAELAFPFGIIPSPEVDFFDVFFTLICSSSSLNPLNKFKKQYFLNYP